MPLLEPAVDAERRVLSYFDVLLREGDLELLRSDGEWLNDQIVAFQFERLLRDVHPGLAGRVALVPASTAFLLLNSDPSDAAAIFGALELHEKELVVFAVNDNPDVDHAAGGSHWSCLAFHRPSNSFRHYDSSRPHNRSVARLLAGAAAPLMRSRRRQQQQQQQQQEKQEKQQTAGTLPSFVDSPAAPQQVNGHDCGLYVLAVAGALCGSLASAGSSGTGFGGASEEQEVAAAEQALLGGITPAAVAELRRQLLATIQRLAAEQQRHQLAKQ